ncbi:orotidine 5'-phosphate decarboxylase [Candidatus Bathyarchaeota archaeon]|nr:orotidine 5'-phosphate decarboxylase [Candidatus Bathyarchaeota archaeon]
MADVERMITHVPRDRRILIEAGTPFVKRYGTEGIQKLAALWNGYIVADIKVADGAKEEVEMAWQAGAHAITALGNSSTETLNIFVQTCESLGMDSMVDMIRVDMPLKVLRPMKKPPTVAILHRGRDEETTRGKVIQYKHITKIKSKYDILISAAGGVDLREAQSAAFNGADIVVVNVVPFGSPWKGITPEQDIAALAYQFLKTIE